MGSFSTGETVWLERLGGLRNIVRQDLIRRQLAEHVTAPVRVLDVGCGQGTQAIHLARLGCAVVGVDPSVQMLQRLAVDAQCVGARVEARVGALADLSDLVGGRTFDLVCAHGLLMYMPDARSALAMLAARVGAGGMLSVTFRNAAALAFRPAMRECWQDALDAMDARGYTNELGLKASAQSLDVVRETLAGLGLVQRAWYGCPQTTRRHPSRSCSTSLMSSIRRADEIPTAVWARRSTSSPNAERGRARRARNETFPPA